MHEQKSVRRSCLGGNHSSTYWRSCNMADTMRGILLTQTELCNVSSSRIRNQLLWQAHFKMTSSNAVRKQILGQLDAIAHSKKRFANVTEPAVVVSTRGRSSRTKRLPSAFEIAKKKAKRSKGKESTKAIPIGNNSRKSSNEVTIVEAKDPKIAGLEQRIRDSYESRTDVQGDGNCGFRVVEHFAMGNKKLWSQV
ncbi:uncharacterized protein [Physcomitrium patens]|uniref:uncharacterized protein isoform X2 n=1 Tax=Physcomitrium patens TaxID=3218 RepID=UPI003CCCEB28